MTKVVDFWINLVSPTAAEAWRVDSVLQGMSAEFLRGEGSIGAYTSEQLIADMDAAGVDVAIVSGSARVGSHVLGRNHSIDEILSVVRTRSDRLRAALLLDGLDSIRAACTAIEKSASEPLVAYVQVVPIVLGEPIDSPRLYPIYERCEALGIPVSINVGVPGPKYRLKFQHPELLDDVMIDFPDLVVVAAHMGHPWEGLLIRLMQKYPNLYLTNSAFLAKYLDPVVLKFMSSSMGAHRVLFGSDGPMIPLARAIGEARKIAVPETALAGFLGGNACKVLGLDDGQDPPV
jgi:uncharacterized protein